MFVKQTHTSWIYIMWITLVLFFWKLIFKLSLPTFQIYSTPQKNLIFANIFYIWEQIIFPAPGPLFGQMVWKCINIHTWCYHGFNDLTLIIVIFWYWFSKSWLQFVINFKSFQTYRNIPVIWTFLITYGFIYWNIFSQAFDPHLTGA